MRDERTSLLISQAQALLIDDGDAVANAANLSSLIFNNVQAINWAGFYFAHGDRLIVGPFQGQPACIEIPFGQGVCGTAAARNETLRVDDVHTFEGHIACDAASASELVVPLVRDGQVFGVLDIDSPKVGRFDESDQAFFETLAGLYSAMSRPLMA
ncbi:MAG: GAF domain-containing protein [Pseudomonadota bacterium]